MESFPAVMTETTETTENLAEETVEITEQPLEAAEESVVEASAPVAEPGEGEPVEAAASGEDGYTPPADQPQVKDPERFTGHKVRLRVFEGPLDLLLYLIRGHRYDIFDIPIQEVTSQFIEYLRAIDDLENAVEFDIEFAGDFCVTAATLMQIKSRMLLPKTKSANEEEGEEDSEENDPRRELVQRLLEYQRMQGAAKSLEEMRDERALLFNRPLLSELPIPPGVLDEADNTPEAQAALLLQDVSTFDLLKALSRVLRKMEERPVALIRREPFSLAERSRGVFARLRKGEPLSFESLCEDCESRLEVVITFLSILELVRRGRAVVKQKAIFDEIWIEKIATAGD